MVVGIDPGTNRARPRDHDAPRGVEVAERGPADERFAEREHRRGAAGVVADHQPILAAFHVEARGPHSDRHQHQSRGGDSDESHDRLAPRIGET